jgi:hypothetical protein
VGPFIPFFMLAWKQLRMLLPRRKQEADAAWAALFIPNPMLRLRDQFREFMLAATPHPHRQRTTRRIDD